MKLNNDTIEMNALTKKEIYKAIEELRKAQSEVTRKTGVEEILSNSKIFEVMIANELGHELIPGHSGSKDARLGEDEMEYKHFKESSSNHTWTFNDFSDTTIDSLNEVRFVYFTHIEDKKHTFPGRFDWYYAVPGNEISEFLEEKTQFIKNKRKMINVSSNQLEKLGYRKQVVTQTKQGKYNDILSQIYVATQRLEDLTGTKNLLTSNKFWELLVALQLNHTVNSEQGGREGAHDAFDKYGNNYEYKVSKTTAWQFQDISENVLKKYLNDKSIILAIVDKRNIELKKIYEADSAVVVELLRKKLNNKISSGKEMRRLQVSLGKGDLKIINAKRIFPID